MTLSIKKQSFFQRKIFLWRNLLLLTKGPSPLNDPNDYLLSDFSELFFFKYAFMYYRALRQRLVLHRKIL